MANKTPLILKGICLCGGIILAILTFFCLYERHYQGLIKPSSKILVIGHRGYGWDAPDNSLMASELALKTD